MNIRKFVGRFTQTFYDLTVGGFLFQKQMLKNGQQYRGYHQYSKGMRAGIEIGRRIEREIGKQNGTSER